MIVCIIINAISIIMCIVYTSRVLYEWNLVIQSLIHHMNNKSIMYVSAFGNNTIATQPILADCIVVRDNTYLDIKGVFSCTNLPDKVCTVLNNNYS